MDGEIKLTKKEERAIARLQRLANSWPQSLMLFSQNGSLLVLKRDKDDPNRSMLKNDLAEIYGIPNDGGDADQE